MRTWLRNAHSARGQRVVEDNAAPPVDKLVSAVLALQRSKKRIAAAAARLTAVHGVEVRVAGLSKHGAERRGMEVWCWRPGFEVVPRTESSPAFADRNESWRVQAGSLNGQWHAYGLWRF